MGNFIILLLALASLFYSKNTMEIQGSTPTATLEDDVRFAKAAGSKYFPKIGYDKSRNCFMRIVVAQGTQKNGISKRIVGRSIPDFMMKVNRWLESLKFKPQYSEQDIMSAPTRRLQTMSCFK